MPGFDVWNPNPEQPAAALEVPAWVPVGFETKVGVRLSQSFVSAWRQCPSSAVAEAQTPSYGPAAAAGIVSHAVIDSRIEGGWMSHPETDEIAALGRMEELNASGWEPDNYDEFIAHAVRLADGLTDLFVDRYLQFKDSDMVTEKHASIVWESDNDFDIDFLVFSGSADLLFTLPDGRRKCVDWKTGKTMPDPWMVQRYGVQWRAYSVLFELGAMDFVYPFALEAGHYTATRYNGLIACESDAVERAAFSEQLYVECLPIAKALLRSTDAKDHVIRPTDWHCSAKWCQRFAEHECLGAHTGVRWINKSHTDAAKDAASNSRKRTA